MKRAVLAAIACCSISLAGCTLGSKVRPLPVRYFSPEVTYPAQAQRLEPQARLTLGRITSGSDLRYRIQRRESAVEVAPYETLRWTERPDVYLRRSLVHALFELHPLEQVVEGAPTLDVELMAFEEVRRGGRHAGRVQLRYQLRDDERVLARGEIALERPAASPAIESVVAAIGAAMEAATRELADRVTSELTR